MVDIPHCGLVASRNIVIVVDTISACEELITSKGFYPVMKFKTTWLF